MTPTNIIKKYYVEGSELYKILLAHSFSVADKALEITRMHPELNIDKRFVYEAALLHDIGIYLTSAPKIYCFGEYPYICHGFLGAEIMRKEGLEKHALVCERHTGSGLSKDYIVRHVLPLPQRDMLPESVEEKLVCFADKFYSKSGREGVKTVDQIRKHLSKYGVNILQRFEDMVKLFL
jgi:uncharacterized protein